MGTNILRSLKSLEDIMPIVLHHHERWDGKGYPTGLQGEDIHFWARITAVADAFDAMISIDHTVTECRAKKQSK